MSVVSNPVHKVRKAWEVGTYTKPRYVVECECGWSSALHFTQGSANEAYKAHREGRDKA